MASQHHQHPHHPHHDQNPNQNHNTTTTTTTTAAFNNIRSGKEAGGAAISGTYDDDHHLGELDQLALFLYSLQQQDSSQHQHHSSSQHHHNHHQNSSSSSPPEMRLQLHTLNIFPSQPMHVEPSSGTPSTKAILNNSDGNGVVCPDDDDTSGCAANNSSSNHPSHQPSINPRPPPADVPSSSHHPPKVVKREGNCRGTASSSEKQRPKTSDPKTLRRLAQNREAARKSRLRKKAYVQQLESSRIRLTQLEQEIQRARSQGLYLGVGGNAGIIPPPPPSTPGDHHHQVAAHLSLPLPPLAMGNIINSSELAALLFDMEYARWVEEQHRLTVELRNAVVLVVQEEEEEELAEKEVGNLVEGWVGHYGQLMCLKNMMAKSDALFHILSGMWLTPAERCFLWIGGFRPSHLIKVMVREIEEAAAALTEQQVEGICGLQQATQEAEEALSQGMDALNHSLSHLIITSSSHQSLLTTTIHPQPPNINSSSSSSSSSSYNMPPQMAALAINKLSTLEAFLFPADKLRAESIEGMREILRTGQIARCLLGLAEYFHRLRALSSLWSLRRPHCPRPPPPPH